MARAAASAGARDAAGAGPAGAGDRRGTTEGRSTAVTPSPASDAPAAGPDDWAAPGRRWSPCGHRRGAGAGRPGPGAHHGHRRARDERAGPDPDRARGCRSVAARPGTRRRSPRCARWAPGRASGTPPSTSPRPTRSSTPPRSTRSTRNSSPPAPVGKPLLRRAAALAAAIEDTPHGRHRRHARQDHDDLAAHRRRPGVRARPVLRDRRQPLRDRQQRPPGHAASWRSSRPTRATARSC